MVRRAILLDEACPGSIRILFTAERMISQRLTGEFTRLDCFLLNFCERLLRLSLNDESFAHGEMDIGSLRVQIQSFLAARFERPRIGPLLDQKLHRRISIAITSVESACC